MLDVEVPGRYHLKVLLVEDGRADAAAIRIKLGEVTNLDLQMAHAKSFADAAAMLAEEQFDVLLLDLTLPDIQGIDTVKRACALAPRTAIVVLTGVEDEALALEALHSGAQDFLAKGDTTGPMAARALRYALERKRSMEERDRLIRELEVALSTVKKLSGLLPICAECKKIRDEKGKWHAIESYIDSHSEATFTHGICPECMRVLYPELMAGMQEHGAQAGNPPSFRQRETER